MYSCLKLMVHVTEEVCHLGKHTCLGQFHLDEDPTHVQLQQMASSEGTVNEGELHSVMGS